MLCAASVHAQSVGPSRQQKEKQKQKHSRHIIRKRKADASTDSHHHQHQKQQPAGTSTRTNTKHSFSLPTKYRHKKTDKPHCKAEKDDGRQQLFFLKPDSATSTGNWVTAQFAWRGILKCCANWRETVEFKNRRSDPLFLRLLQIVKQFASAQELMSMFAQVAFLCDTRCHCRCNSHNSPKFLSMDLGMQRPVGLLLVSCDVEFGNETAIVPTCFFYAGLLTCSHFDCETQTKS